MALQFKNRTEAGQHLAKRLLDYANRQDVVVLALPRGGVPVAYPIAKALQAPLDLCLVRKLGVPGHKELAMGAIAPGGIRVLNQRVLSEFRVSPKQIEAVAAQERKELERRDRTYRGQRPPPLVQQCSIILVDDGLATGSTMRAAVEALQQQHPYTITVAVPVAPANICHQLQAMVEQCVCLLTPDPLYAIGNWYEDFSQTTDAEVCELLAAQELWMHAAVAAAPPLTGTLAVMYSVSDALPVWA